MSPGEPTHNRLPPDATGSDEIARKLSQAIAEADASGEPIPMTGPQLTERLRRAVREHRAD